MKFSVGRNQCDAGGVLSLDFVSLDNLSLSPLKRRFIACPNSFLTRVNTPVMSSSQKSQKELL